MYPDAVESICAALASGEAVLIWDDVEGWPEPLLRSMVKSGLLVEREPATSVQCDACQNGHVETVERIDRDCGSVEFVIYCPAAGLVTVAPARLRQWRVSFEVMARLLGRLMGIPGAPEVRDGDELALNGEWSANGLTLDLWLTRGPEQAVRLRGEGKTRAVLLSARRPDWSDLPGQVAIVGLADVLTIDGGALAIDRERLARKVRLQRQLAGIDPGRPDGFYLPGTIIWNRIEHACSLTHQQQRFMSAAMMNERTEIESLMGLDSSAVWRGAYSNSRRCRNKVSGLLTRLNAALELGDPRVPLKFELPDKAPYVRRVATDAESAEVR